MRTHPFLKRTHPYFKLIGGANFTDYSQLRELVAIYAQAGCDLIDVAATPEAVQAAISGIQAAGASAPLVMVSVTASDDPHCHQAVQNPLKCSHLCPHCLNACPHGAIAEDLTILPARCVGCGLCLPPCPYEAIALEARPFNPSLDQLWELGARGLELHTGSGRISELEAWRESCVGWVMKGGLFSASLNAAQLELSEAIALARWIIGWFPEDRIVLQADGKPISGREDRESTLPALSFAEALLGSHLPAVIQPSGGANQWTGPLAAQRGMAIGGIGIGSYARCIIAGELEHRQVARARQLVRSVQEGEEVTS